MHVAANIPLASGSFLITPNVGLMIWTIVVFAISLAILRKWIFPVIGQALDARAKKIEGDIDAAEELRTEADQILTEYRARLRSRTRPRARSAGRSSSPRRPRRPSAKSRRPRSGRSRTSAARSPT